MSDGILGKVNSISGANIHLSFERWYHISEGHPELLGKHFEILIAVNTPDFLLSGKEKEILAVKKVNSNNLLVVYKEQNKQEGFVITAFYTKAKGLQSIMKKYKILWKK